MCSSAGTNGNFNYNLITFFLLKSKVCNDFPLVSAYFGYLLTLKDKNMCLWCILSKSFYADLKKSWTFPDPGKSFWYGAVGRHPGFSCLTILAHILTCEPLYQYNNRDTTRASLMVHTFSLAMIRYLQIEIKKIILLLESIRKCLERSQSKVCCAASRALFRGTFILHRPKPKIVPTNVSISSSLEPSRHVIL